MDTVTIVVVMGCLLLVLALLLLIKKSKENTAGSADYLTVKTDHAAHHKNYLENLYRFFRAAPILKNYFSKINEKVRLQYPADAASINRRTTKILAKGTIFAVAVIVASVLLAGGDIFFICSGILLGYIVLSSIVNASLIGMENKILSQFSDALSKVRHYYHDSGIVEDAISNTIDELPYTIGLHFQTIYNIITNPKMDTLIDEYVGTEPNQYMLMFLQICASIKEFGDRKLNDGTSLFLSDINYLKEEVNNEIIANRKNTAKFKGLPAYAIAPIIGIKPVEMWAKGNMPEMATYYSGLYGIVSMVVVFIISIICHELITTLRDGGAENEKDSSIFAALSEIPLLSHYLVRIINKKYTKYQRYDDDMRGMGDRTGPKAFLLKRLTMFAGAFVAVIIVFIAADITQRFSYINNFTDAFAESMAPDDDYRETMEDVAKDYANMYKSNADITSDKLTIEILTDTEINNELLAANVATKVIERIAKRLATYFKWWYILIAISAGMIGFFFPVWLLRFKKSLIEMRKEEEVIQFQSLMLILMHINGTTLPVILEWMERFSYCFKESITQCRINLNSGSQKALEDMKDREVFGPFRDFIDNLLSIDKVGVERAFDEIQTDREYYKKKREQDRGINIERKASKANRIVIVPLASLFLFYLLIPMGMYALNMLQTFTTTISGAGL